MSRAKIARANSNCSKITRDGTASDVKSSADVWEWIRRFTVVTYLTRASFKTLLQKQRISTRIRCPRLRYSHFRKPWNRRLFSLVIFEKIAFTWQNTSTYLSYIPCVLHARHPEAVTNFLFNVTQWVAPLPAQHFPVGRRKAISSVAPAGEGLLLQPLRFSSIQAIGSV